MESNIDQVGVLEAEAMAWAIASKIKNSKAAYGYPGYAENVN